MAPVIDLAPLQLCWVQLALLEDMGYHQVLWFGQELYKEKSNNSNIIHFGWFTGVMNVEGYP